MVSLEETEQDNEISKTPAMNTAIRVRMMPLRGNYTPSLVECWRLALEDGLHNPEGAGLESVQQVGEHERRGRTEDYAETEGLG